MSNMSYCRFQNTLRDLQDCNYALNNATNGSEEDKLSRPEAQALVEMIEVMGELLETMGYSLEDISTEAVTSMEDLKEFRPEVLDF